MKMKKYSSKVATFSVADLLSGNRFSGFKWSAFFMIVFLAAVMTLIAGSTVFAGGNAKKTEINKQIAGDFQEIKADVVIYGGTSAAVSAAVQVKKMGKSVVIVCPDSHLGGLSSSGLGATDSGERRVIGGLSKEFYHRLWQYYQNTDSWKWQKQPNMDIPGQGGRGIDNASKTMWVFEPHAAQLVFDGMINEYKIPVYYKEWLDREKGVVKSGAKIQSIKMLSGKKFLGKIFLDVTYEGDLMASAGVKYTVGRESNDQYGESLNGIETRMARWHQFEGLVDPYVVPGKPESGLLPYVHEKIDGPDGSADNFIQAYNLRLCMTKNPENRVSFEKPENYNELEYELLFRNIAAGQKVFMIDSMMPNFKTDTNNNKGFSTDLIGGNYDYPEASYEKRKEIYEKHRVWCQGFFWSLGHHPRVPEKIRNVFKDWGLAKDEFVQNNHWPDQMYVREARRMIGDFVVSERHLRYLDPTPRPIGMGSYNMDSHHAQRYVDYEMFGKPSVRNEGDVQVNPGGPYPIDYGAILPKRGQADNLLVPVCVSSTHIAFGSIRMEPVFMVLGQSAATAAVFAIENGIAPIDLDYKILKARLLEDGQVLDASGLGIKRRTVPPASLKGLVIDDTQAVVKGEWGTSNVCSKFVGTGYLHDANENKGKKSIEYHFKLDQPGVYDCRISYNPNPNRAVNVPVVVVADGEVVLEKKVNQKIAPPIDELFVSIGLIRAEKEIVIKIDTKGTDGHVIVDAAQLLKNK